MVKDNFMVIYPGEFNGNFKIKNSARFTENPLDDEISNKRSSLKVSCGIQIMIFRHKIPHPNIKNFGASQLPIVNNNVGGWGLK